MYVINNEKEIEGGKMCADGNEISITNITLKRKKTNGFFRLHNINSLLHRYHIPFLFSAINYWFS